MKKVLFFLFASVLFQTLAMTAPEPSPLLAGDPFILDSRQRITR